MELCKILADSKKINNKAEKLDFLIENIWATLYEGLANNNLNTPALRTLTIDYIKCSFDAENVETSFEEYANNENGFYDEYSGVKININNFQIGEKALDDMLTYSKFINTVSHEFTHHNDKMSNKINYIEHDPRFAEGYGYSGCVSALGKIYGKENYKKLGYALYYMSSNECVARKVSYNFTQSFAKQLRKLTNEKLPKREDALSHTEKLKELMNSGLFYDEASVKANYTYTDYISKWMHIAIDNIEDTISKYQEVEHDLPYVYNNVIKTNLLEAQQDFFNQCNKYLTGQYTEKEFNMFKPSDMAILLTKPEFFNKDIGNKLYKHILRDKNLNNGMSIIALHELSSIKELNIPQKERQQHFDNYQEYQTFLANLDKKNLSK